jgi:hypothetical protein
LPAQTGKGIVMSMLRENTFLRRALLLDAAASGAAALLLLFGGALIAGLLGLPEALLRGGGAVLVPYVAFVVWVASRAPIPAAGVRTIIVANALWAAASVALLFAGWVAPTALGYAFVIGQALVVAALGELQYVGLRRPARAAA